jgi:hypothetical protein
MPTVESLGPELVVVSHSGDHFVLTVREARELRDHITRVLRHEDEIDLSEEDG